MLTSIVHSPGAASSSPLSVKWAGPARSGSRLIGPSPAEGSERSRRDLVAQVGGTVGLVVGVEVDVVAADTGRVDHELHRAMLTEVDGRLRDTAVDTGLDSGGRDVDEDSGHGERHEQAADLQAQRLAQLTQSRLGPGR